MTVATTLQLLYRLLYVNVKCRPQATLMRLLKVTFKTCERFELFVLSNAFIVS